MGELRSFQEIFSAPSGHLVNCPAPFIENSSNFYHQERKPLGWTERPSETESTIKQQQAVRNLTDGTFVPFLPESARSSLGCVLASTIPAAFKRMAVRNTSLSDALALSDVHHRLMLESLLRSLARTRLLCPESWATRHGSLKFRPALFGINAFALHHMDDFEPGSSLVRRLHTDCVPLPAGYLPDDIGQVLSQSRLRRKIAGGG